MKELTMRLKKYIKNLFSLLFLCSAIAHFAYGMKKKNSSGASFTKQNVMICGISALSTGSLAYNTFPNWMSNFLNPSHIYMIEKEFGPRPMWVINAMRSALFGGTLLNGAYARETFAIATGVTFGVAALQVKRAGIPFLCHGSDQKEIDRIVANSTIENNEKLRQIFKYLPYDCSYTETVTRLKTAIINDTESQVTDLRQKNKMKKKLDEANLPENKAKTFYQKNIYFPIKGIANNSQEWYKRFPAKATMAFLHEPKKMDYAVGIINKPSYGAYALSAFCAGLAGGLLEMQSCNKPLNITNALKYGTTGLIKYGTYGLVAPFLYRRIMYPTRDYAARAFCKVMHEKYS
jgi:hypothetical protein